MRIIKNLDDSRTKYGDTNTVFRLNLLNNEELVDTTNKTLRLNIANESGLVLSKEIKTDFAGYIELDFSDPELQKLTPDHYLLEYEYTLPDGDVAKYPTTGGLAFTITSNLKETNGSLVSNITFDEVLTAVDEKIAVYLATVQKGDKGDTGATGATGQNGKDGDVLSTKDNKFTGSNTFTQPIDGALNTRLATFTDFADVAKNMIKYAGNWAIKGGHVGNSPVPDNTFMVVEVIPGDSVVSGKIIVTPYDGSIDNDNTIYYAVIKSDGIINWKKIAKDETVVHNTGNENISGAKNFFDVLTALSGIKGDVTGSLKGNATSADTLNTRLATFTDFADVAKNMIKYAGNWAIKGGHVGNSPVPDNTFMVVEVIPGDSVVSGKISVIPYDGPGSDYTMHYAIIKYNGIINWEKLAKDTTVVHKTGMETIAGDKTFTGVTDIQNQKQYKASFTIGANTINLTRIGAMVYVNARIKEKINGMSINGAIPIGFTPANYSVVNFIRGADQGSCLFQPEKNVFFPVNANIDANISGSYLTNDALPSQ